MTEDLGESPSALRSTGFCCFYGYGGRSLATPLASPSLYLEDNAQALPSGRASLLSPLVPTLAGEFHPVVLL